MFLLVLLPAAASAKFDPSFEWMTLETPHFLIHYHQDGLETARRAAGIAEEVHRRLAPRIKWEPAERTRIVLVDATDDPNGAAQSIPYNRIVVYLTPPAGSQGLGLVHYDDWLRLVITHEYAHILQLDMVHGLPGALQYLFGRLYFPNAFQPQWLIEGLATYEETEQTSGGRGRSPGADMVLRMAVLEDRFPTLGEMAVLPDSWPAGQVPYLFGESFLRFLAGRYGRARVSAISENYSQRWFPYLVDSTARRTFDRGYRALYEEWVLALRERYRDKAEQVRAAGPTPSRELTAKGFIASAPSFAPDGRRIAYAVARGDEFPGIYLIDANGGEDRKVVENVFPHSASGTAIAWGPDGERLYYTKSEIVRNTADYNDLYLYDLGLRKEHRLTRGLRARDPHVSPDGTWLVFVMARRGLSRVALLNLEAGSAGPAGEDAVVPVTEWSAGQYETPRWAPDGASLAVGIWRPGGYRDIRILDAAGNLLEEVTDDRAIDASPAWGPDGKVLYFSSDRSGIFNLYAYDGDTKELRQVTNVVGGAFAPSISPDGATIAFASYSSRGFDIHTMAADDGAARPASPYEDQYPTPTYDTRPVEAESRPYSPLSTIYPRFWMPTYGTNPASGAMVGAFTFHEDAVQRHRYLASVYYGPSSHRRWYRLDYFYEGFFPSLQFHTSDIDATHSGFLHDATGSRSYVEQVRTAGGAVVFPVLRNARQQSLALGYRQRRLAALTVLPPWAGYAGPLPGEGLLASGRARWLFNSTREYAYSVSPEDGRKLAFGVERYDKALGSDLDYTRYTADWHEYLGLPPRHHVLLARGFYGTSTGAGPPQGVYELGGDSPGDIITALDDSRLSLRGYPTGVLRGRKAALATVEYRFPFLNIEGGADTAPFFARRLHAALFYEAGSAWDTAYRSADLRKAAGVEARMNILFSYYLPITLRLVAAKGLDEDGEAQLYFAFWVPTDLW